jgi:hypothetical protein
MPRQINVENPASEAADFSSILDRVFIFDDVFSSTQLLLLQKWALETPHWMLNNAVFASDGSMQHRIWGASYMGSWKRGGWPALPPTFFAAIGAVFKRLGVAITNVQYVGLNGQLRGQDASMHTDCMMDAEDQLSILIYVGEDTDGDLLLFDKEDHQAVLERVPFRPNRIVAFDGSIPHRAMAPTNDRFRVSGIVRGTYQNWNGARAQLPVRSLTF